MKKKLVVVLLLAVVVLLAFYLWMPGKAPADQQPLVNLSPSNIGQFENAFDGRTDVPRVILLFSPT